MPAKHTSRNWIGGVLVIVPAVIFTAQYFVDLKQEVDNTLLGIACFVGLTVWTGLFAKLFTIITDRFITKK